MKALGLLVLGFLFQISKGKVRLVSRNVKIEMSAIKRIGNVYRVICLMLERSLFNDYLVG